MKAEATPSSLTLLINAEYWLTEECILVTKPISNLLATMFALGTVVWLLILTEVSLSLGTFPILQGLSGVIIFIVGAVCIFEAEKLFVRRRLNRLARFSSDEIANLASTKRIEWSKVSRAVITGRRLSMEIGDDPMLSKTLHATIRESELTKAIELLSAILGGKLMVH